MKPSHTRTIGRLDKLTRGRPSHTTLKALLRLLHAVLVVATLAALAQRSSTLLPGRRVCAVTELSPLVRFANESVLSSCESRCVRPYLGFRVSLHARVRACTCGEPFADGTGRVGDVGSRDADLCSIRRVSTQLVTNRLEGSSQRLEALLTSLHDPRRRGSLPLARRRRLTLRERNATCRNDRSDENQCDLHL